VVPEAEIVGGHAAYTADVDPLCKAAACLDTVVGPRRADAEDRPGNDYGFTSVIQLTKLLDYG
jgi:hypothetical protein